MTPGMEPNDLLGMSLDQISSRSGRITKTGSSSGAIGGTWSGGRPGVGEARGRDGGGGGMRSEISRPKSVVGGGTFRSAIASTRASHVSGPVRRAGVARSARDSTAPYQRPTRTSESIFDRLGGKVGDDPGTRVRVQGLNHDVMQEDIEELFSGVGGLLHCEVDFDVSGRSNGSAMVIFKKREDAESAVAQFHNRTLDGTPMHVEIVEGPKPRPDGVRGRGPATVGGGGSGGGGGSTWREPQNSARAANGAGRGGYSGGLGGFGDGRAAPLPRGNSLIASAINRLPQSRVAVPPYARASQPPPRPARIPNVRENLFGTALEDDMRDVPVADLDDVVVPSMNGYGGGGGDRGGERERNEQNNVSFQVTVTTPPHNVAGGGGGRGGGGGGGGGFRNRGDGGGSNSFLSRNGGSDGRVGRGGEGMRSSGGGRGGGGRRGGNRGGEGGGGYGGGKKSAGDAISTVDLDAQLDAHMAKR